MAVPNFKDKTVWVGDNLPVMRGMNSACVDLIYLDPPFNSNQDYAAPIGSVAAGAAFKDTWTLSDVDVHEHGELADRHPAAYSVIEAARVTHGKGMMSYLIMMAVRLMEMRRILKPSGSLYLHCDTTASHYLKLLLDAVFGKDNFRNEIIWWYRRWPSRGKNFQRMHDVVLRYSLSDSWTWNQLYDPLSESSQRMWKGKRRIDVTDAESGRRHSVTGDAESKGVPMRDVWEISVVHPASKERTGYPTQKPLALLDRIIEASSNEGDLVFDPFCGCATTLVAAELQDRRWIGCDLSPLAIKLVNERIRSYQLPMWRGVNVLETPPKRSDLGKLPNYRTHRHRLYGEQEGNCVGCGLHFPFNIMDVDHIVPKSRGGNDHPDNLQLLCSGCNRSKGSKTMAEWRASQER